MLIKPKLYKTALVSIVMVLMLISTASAFPFCGCGYGCGDQSCDHSSNDKVSDASDHKCIVCPGCPSCPACNCPTCPACNCPTCAAPALSISKTGVLANDTTGCPINITYNYTVTNIGNIPVSGIVIYDNITSPTGIPINAPIILNPNGSATVSNVVYTGPFPVTLSDDQLNENGNVTNLAFATANGLGINVVSNRVSVPINYTYPAPQPS